MIITSHIYDLCGKYPYNTDQQILNINIKAQRMDLYRWESNTLVFIKQYLISSALAGIGNQEGSGKTPLGAHYIRQCIGHNALLGSIFKARKKTGKIALIDKQPIYSSKEFITSRILWLSGLEKGVNLGANIDSYQRYIYIHGTNEEGLIGKAVSKGCIRMKNNDIIDLFEKTPLHSLVYIQQ